ncbi:MAG: hypothetical protein EPO30_00295 [Lysobacteraceae bacterium]|nr:MAG: hypothetical protein EPO30_00295 [Xanthomonadaceae bacterium]
MPFLHGQVVLVDTNVIIEAHRTGCWPQLAGFFRIQTVEKIVEETQTGYQNRRPEHLIDEAALRSSLDLVHDISDEQRARFNLAYGHPSLDPGERDLLVYADSVAADAWLLNSPDMALVRFAHGRQWLDRLVSLEAMASHLRARLKYDLAQNYCERWLSERKTRLILGA